MGSIDSHTPNISISAIVIMKLGTDTNSDAMNMNTRSNIELCFIAANTPSGIPINTASASAIRPSLQDTGK